LVFALAQGLFWAGIAATFVMGLGTAITVATIAVIAVSAKDLAQRSAAAARAAARWSCAGMELRRCGAGAAVRCRPAVRLPSPPSGDVSVAWSGGLSLSDFNDELVCQGSYS
jgi:hypothetical protein